MWEYQSSLCLLACALVDQSLGFALFEHSLVKGQMC